MTDAGSATNGANSESRTLDGRYRLDALLDTGSGRTLWRATDLQNQHTVSVQLWDASTSPAEGAMTAGRLRQPEGVHAAFVGMEWSGRTPEGQAYAVHPSLAGRYLDSWLKEHPLTPNEALELAAEITGALGALHKSGVVHGSLESNALIVSALDGDAPALQIVDAGMASQPAVPHGSAVKGELTKAGALLERLAELGKQSSVPDTTSAMQALATLGKRAQAAEGVVAFDAMVPLDDAVQVLATMTPGKRVRNGARKVASTMDFSAVGSGVQAAVAASQQKQAGLAETLEAEALPAGFPDEFMPDFDGVDASPAGVDVTDAMSSLLIPASALSQPAVSDQMLPEVQLTTTAPRPVAAPMPREPKGKKGLKTKDHTPSPAPVAAVPVKPPPSLPAPTVKPAIAGGDGPKRGPAIVVALLLLVVIALFLFVLLPGPDRPATPMQAVLVAAADAQSAPEIAPEPDAAVVPEEIAAEEIALAAVEVVEAADVLTPDTEPTPDTAPAPDTELAPDTAQPETVAPETIAPETIAPETVVAETIAPEIVAQPETASPVESDEFAGIVAPPLPGSKDVRSPEQLAAALRATETIITRNRTDGRGAGVTAPLLAKLEATFNDGDVVTLHLRGMYFVAMKMLNSGASDAAIGAEIITRHDAGRF